MYRYLLTLSFVLVSIVCFSQETSEEKEIFEFVDEVPVPPGGMGAFYAYLGKNIKYPKEASYNNIQGTVYLELIIGKDGKVRDVTILKNIGGGCGEEAKRVVEQMPAWIPGKQKGEPVAVRIKLPVKFILHDPTLIPVYDVADEMPSFPGGVDSLNKFIEKNINYPHLAVKRNIQGTVYITFVVDTEGNTTDLKIAKDIGSRCGDEAVRLIKLTKWSPGKFNGEKVNVRMSVPVEFRLPDESTKKDKKKKKR